VLPHTALGVSAGLGGCGPRVNEADPELARPMPGTFPAAQPPQVANSNRIRSLFLANMSSRAAPLL